jgi:hypothetical protein
MGSHNHHSAPRNNLHSCPSLDSGGSRQLEGNPVGYSDGSLRALDAERMDRVSVHYIVFLVVWLKR